MVPVAISPGCGQATTDSGRVDHAGRHDFNRRVLRLAPRLRSLAFSRWRLTWLPLATFSLLVSPALAQQANPPAAPSGPATSGPLWDGTVELYGFLPWLQSTTTVGGFTAITDLDPAEILQTLQSSFSARGSLERDRLGLQLDVAYNQLGAARSRSTSRGLFTGTSEVTTINGVYDAALRWRLGQRERPVGSPGSGWLIPYAGIRVVQARLDVAAELQGNGPLGLSLQRQGTLERTWTQPLLGVQGSLFLTPRLRAFARGDLGGCGLAGAEDFSANAQAGFGYAIGNSTAVNLSWRYQTLRWNNGAQRSNGFSADQNGVELGLKVYF
jgi:hypothetical protein